MNWCVLEYAKKLMEAGVSVEFHLFKGAIHAFYTLPGIMFIRISIQSYSTQVVQQFLLHACGVPYNDAIVQHLDSY